MNCIECDKPLSGANKSGYCTAHRHLSDAHRARKQAERLRRYEKDEGARERERRAALKWYYDHQERAKATSRMSAHKRRAILRNAVGSFGIRDVRSIYKLQRGKCAYCRKKLGDDYHIDHIVALINGGRNDRRNLQILCHRCNHRKRAKDPMDYARSLGLLL